MCQTPQLLLEVEPRVHRSQVDLHIVAKRFRYSRRGIEMDDNCCALNGGRKKSTGASGSFRLLLTLFIILGATFLTICVALAYPIFWNLFFLPSHYHEHRSEHPSSPIKPTQYRISNRDVESFQRDGLLILRDVLPQNLVDKLVIAGDDLMDVPTRHCQMTKYTGPPIFHGYERYCGRAQLVHDYLRDVAFTSPLTHVAAQLMGASETETIRQLADVFMAGINIPRRWHNDYLAFQKAMKKREEVKCNDGLIFWIPLEKSYETKNGMLFLNGTSQLMEETFAGDPREARDIFKMKRFVRGIPKDDYVAPTLDLGDVVVFDQCTVHAASGVNTEGLLRRAYQLRFIRNAVDIFRDLGVGREKGPQFLVGPPQHADMPGATMPQIWPTTIEDEDRVRAAGPIVFSRAQWIERMTVSPLFTFVTSSIALRTRLFGDKGELHGESQRGIDDLLFSFMKQRKY